MGVVDQTMSGRGMSPGRTTRLGDVQEILNKLKAEVADLREQVKAAGSTYFHKFEGQLQIYEDAMDGLKETLQTIAQCTRNNDGEGIPERAAINQTQVASELGHYEEDVGKSLRSLASHTQQAKLAYHEFAVVVKDAVNDADKMDIVVKGCQAEFIKLKLTTNNIKARLNAHRLRMANKGRAFKEWAEMVHFETIECIRREMEEVEQEAADWRREYGEQWARAQAEWDALMSGNRRIKVAMMLKKMKNSRAACAFSTWVDTIAAIKLARAEAELDAELAAMRAKLAAMQDNSMMAKLKLFFKKKLEGLKGVTFQAMVVNCNQSKARKLLDSEAGKRIKTFLKNKLASIGRQCWQAWLQHHDHIAAENIKNNENAKKVGIMLEKIARSLVHRCFNAFVRYQLEAAEERAAADALASRLAKMDDLYKAKLRVFLDAKRLGKMSSLFKHWSNVTANRGANELLAAIEHEDELINALKARLAEAEGALAGQGRHSASLARTLKDLESAYDAEIAKHSGLQSEIARINKTL